MVVWPLKLISYLAADPLGKLDSCLVITPSPRWKNRPAQHLFFDVSNVGTNAQVIRKTCRAPPDYGQPHADAFDEGLA